MKTRNLGGIVLIIGLIANCTHANYQKLNIEHAEHYDSVSHVDVSMKLDLPLATDSVSTRIRQDLVLLIDSQMHSLGFGEEEFRPQTYSADITDIDNITKFYCDQAVAQTNAMATEDYDYRINWVKSDDSMTEEMKNQIIADTPRWEFDFEISLISDTLGYIVFNSQNYVYMGGAHGGVTGSGAVTYSRADGHRIYQFLNEGSADALQPLLIEGLKSYYTESGESMTTEELLEHLFIEGGNIPLPAYTPYPTANGLVFVYQQYEIASYADGMPSFTIPFEQLQSFLTADALSILGK